MWQENSPLNLKCISFNVGLVFCSPDLSPNYFQWKQHTMYHWDIEVFYMKNREDHYRMLSSQLNMYSFDVWLVFCSPILSLRPFYKGNRMQFIIATWWSTLSKVFQFFIIMMFWDILATTPIKLPFIPYSFKISLLVPELWAGLWHLFL